MWVALRDFCDMVASSRVELEYFSDAGYGVTRDVVIVVVKYPYRFAPPRPLVSGHVNA